MPSPLRRPVHDGVRLGTISRVDHQTLDSTLIPGWGSPGTTHSTPLVASSTARASGDTESSGSSTPTSLSPPPPPHLPLLQDEKPRYVRRPPGRIKTLSKKIMFCSAWVFVIGSLCVCLYNYRYNANGLIPLFAPSDVGVPSKEKGTPSSTTQHGNYGDSSDNGKANSSDSTEAIVSYVDPDLELGLSFASSPSVPTPTSQTADTKDTSYSPSTTLMTATITMTNERLPGATATSPAVTLRQGRYIGVHFSVDYRFPKAIEAFRGVPFAQTTGGENRFRPPKALPDSDQTFQAIKFGENCPIGGTVGNGFGENCLNANIYRPAGLVDDDGLKIGDSNKRPALLPVVVYIHGGAFNGGMGPERNMASFVSWADAPMLGINFNYRVGALGFLPSALTAKEGLLNLGLRDQTMLLAWVRENVKAFGGDPDNVTIMGLSAGAHSVSFVFGPFMSLKSYSNMSSYTPRITLLTQYSIFFVFFSFSRSGTISCTTPERRVRHPFTEPSWSPALLLLELSSSQTTLVTWSNFENSSPLQAWTDYRMIRSLIIFASFRSKP